MIKQEFIEKLVSEILTGEYFIVRINVKNGNVIEIIIDGDNGVNIQKCADVSRHVEQNLNKENEDFELNVSSAGLNNPFLVYRQYLKNIGKKVEVKLKNENPVAGIITRVDPEGFDLEIPVVEKDSVKKKNIEKLITHHISFENKPEVKNIISFK
jgi:ribosome maturation factor RimP